MNRVNPTSWVAGVSRLAATVLDTAGAILTMRARTLLTQALISLLLPAGCHKGDPLPGGCATFIASSPDILLVDKQSVGVAGAHRVKIGNSGALIFGEIQLMPRTPAKDCDTPGFFILDSTTGAMEKDLSREAWLTHADRLDG